MLSVHRVRGRLAIGGFVTLALAAGCGEQSVLSPTSPLESSAAGTQSLAPMGASLDRGRSGSSSTIPTPSQVVISSDGGMFVPFVANNSRRETSEFWDNFSADATPTSPNCNVGFYASGTFSSGCQYGAPGSNANQGGYLTGAYLARNLNMPAAFVFNGAYSYTVRFLGTYTAAPSEVGYFTKTGTAYVLHPFTFAVNGTATVNTGGQNWGFYIRNNFNPDQTGCSTTPSGAHCSDATGGYTMVPFQQFALFRNSTGTSYLVGAEDNRLETIPTGASGRDSDYNDYMFSVVPAAVKSCNDGDSDRNRDKSAKDSKQHNDGNDCDDDKDKKKCDADKGQKDAKSHDENHDCRGESGERHDE
jgi:hypothetical protein